MATLRPFKRLKWRLENLTLREFGASLIPETVDLPRVERTPLLQRPPFRCVPLRAGPAFPFLVIGPGGLDRKETALEAVEASGARVISHHPYQAYPELAWDLYGLALQRAAEKRRSLLRFNLDLFLYASRSIDCHITFFEMADREELRRLKKHVRRAIGPIRFYRVRHGKLTDTALTSFVHMPDAGRVDAESLILQAHGITPRTASRAAMSTG